MHACLRDESCLRHSCNRLSLAVPTAVNATGAAMGSSSIIEG